MDANSDLTDLLAALNSAKARYLVVGAHAVAYHTEPRYTKDFDIWVEAAPENAERVWRALVAFGAPLKGMSPADFANPQLVYQMGVEPHRIDILMGLDGLEFPSAWKNRQATRYNGLRVYVLGRQDLIRNKRATGRRQDLLDLDRLKSPEKRKSAGQRPRRDR